MRISKIVYIYFFGISVVTLLSGCGSGFSSSEGGGGGSSTPSYAPEKAYCSTVYSVSDPTTITGTAKYYYRTLSNFGLTTPTTTPPGIPYAEIEVTNSAGAIVQCGTTDELGGISLQIPRVADTYTLTVYSRADNAFVKVSVLEDIYSNQPYSISSIFTITTETTKNIGTFYAYARSAESAKIEGGAFNIYNDIYLANKYIRTAINDTSFVAPKVTVYWKAGFNPYSYFNYPDNLLSFYSPGESKLYILGGYNGDVLSSDTDHFDNSVILHEYGHFLEDNYAKSESPGGSHNGNALIDPRLAWSEGWANFIQAAVQSSNFYIDTIGVYNDPQETGENGGIAIKVDLSATAATASFDAVSSAGEGTFREMSISRTLFKAISTTTTPNASLPFSKIWTAFSDKTNGLGASNSIFKNISLFNYFLFNNTGLTGTQQTNLDSVFSEEKQNRVTKDYANTLVQQVGACSISKTITPTIDSNYESNQLTSNDFYKFYHDGVAKTISLNYAQGGSQTIDLDLILWKSNYVYIEEYDEQHGVANPYYIVRSKRLNPSIENGYESINLSGVPAGYYLLNIKANTYTKTNAQLNGNATYTLTVTTNGTTENLCPAN